MSFFQEAFDPYSLQGNDEYQFVERMDDPELEMFRDSGFQEQSSAYPTSEWENLLALPEETSYPDFQQPSANPTSEGENGLASLDELFAPYPQQPPANPTSERGNSPAVLEETSYPDVQQPPANPTVGTSTFNVLAREKWTERVETALKIKLQWSNPPLGIERLRIHTNHLRSLKVREASKNEPIDGDTVELRGFVFFARAMDSDEKRARALAKAKACMENRLPGSGTETSDSGPLLTPCTRCINREVLRVTRSTSERPRQTSATTPELVEEISRSMLGFLGSKMTREWQSPSSESESPQPGTIAVDLHLRICCYSRHHDERAGFRVIFFLSNNRGEIVAETITPPILIEDAHKESRTPAVAPPTAQPPVNHPLPENGQGANPPYPLPRGYHPPPNAQRRVNHRFPDHGQPAVQQRCQRYTRLDSSHPAPQPASMNRLPDNGQAFLPQQGFNQPLAFRPPPPSQPGFNNRFPDFGKGLHPQQAFHHPPPPPTSQPGFNSRLPDTGQGLDPTEGWQPLASAPPPFVNSFPDMGQSFVSPPGLDPSQVWQRLSPAPPAPMTGNQPFNQGLSPPPPPQLVGPQQFWSLEQHEQYLQQQIRQYGGPPS